MTAIIRRPVVIGPPREVRIGGATLLVESPRRSAFYCMGYAGIGSMTASHAIDVIQSQEQRLRARFDYLRGRVAFDCSVPGRAEFHEQSVAKLQAIITRMNKIEKNQKQVLHHATL